MLIRIMPMVLVLVAGVNHSIAEADGGASTATKGEAPSRQPAFLCLTPSTKETYGRNEVERVADQVERELKRRGFQRGWHVGWHDLSLPYLKQFNAVILYDFSSCPPEGPTPEIKRQLQLLRRYVEEGGGVLIGLPTYLQSKIPTINEFLQPMAAEVFLELVKDAEHFYKPPYPSPGLGFSWTGAIAPHRLTAGVAGLFYGVDFWEPGSPTTCPLQAGPGWEVLVRGMPSAASYRVDPNSTATTGVGRFPHSPALLAVRELGKGRVVLWPMSLSYTLMDGYNPMLQGGLVMEGSAAGKTSQAAKLTYALLDWLVEPSSKLDQFGGYVSAPPSREKPPAHRPVVWTAVPVIRPMYRHAYLGLVGAMSNLSRGETSPQELVRAAKSCGYEFLVFTEDLEAISQENWERLVAICRAESDARFAALPGFYYKTPFDAEYITFGNPGDLSYPLPAWLAEVGGKRRLKENNCFTRGLKEVPPIVMVYPHRNPRPLRVNAEFYGFSTHTYQAGALADEAVRPYLDLQREDLMLFPMAVHFVKSGAEVAQARAGGMQTYVRAESAERIATSVAGFMQSLNSPGWCKPAFVSSGPEIGWFYAQNWGTADLAIPGADRHRLQILVESKVGLREVRVLDNASLFRRYLLQGAPQFRQSIDNYHDMEHSYVVEAIDVEGGKALSWSQSTSVQECAHGMCGDNWNDMPLGKYCYAAGSKGLELRGTECRGLLPASLWFWPYLTNQERHGWFATLKQSGIVTRFGWMVDYSLDHVYAHNGCPGAACDSERVLANPDFRGRLRSCLITAQGERPNVWVMEGEIAFCRDGQMKGTPGLGAAALELSQSGVGSFVWPGPDGRLKAAARSGAGPVVEGLLKPDQYVGFYPPMAALVNLGAEEMPYRIAGRGISLGCGRTGETFKSQDRRRWRVLGVTSGDMAPDSRFMDRFLTSMGLSGPPAYTVVPKIGQVENTRYYLRLKADHCGFRGRISKAALPVMLPVLCSGLNPRWSAGIWYKGDNSLKVIEYPHRVVERRCRDEIIRIGVLDATAYLQVDLDADRDVFIGNLLVSDQAEIGLTLIQDPGRAWFVAHNPTDGPITTTIRPGPGFELLGNFEKRLTIPAGSSITAEIK